jgi:hypothetical protein
VLFRVKDGIASALAAAPSALAAGEVRRLQIPLTPGSLLQRAHATGTRVRERAAVDPLQKIISAYLRAPDPGEVCVLPISVARRVISLICVQLPGSETWVEQDLDRLGRLAEAVAGAYLRLIQEARSRAAPVEP